MPIRTNGLRMVSPYEKRNVPLFKNGTLKTKQVVCCGNSLIKDSNFNPLQTFTLNLIEKVNSVIKDHPKIGGKLLSISEKILKSADCLK